MSSLGVEHALSGGGEGFTDALDVVNSTMQPCLPCTWPHLVRLLCLQDGLHILNEAHLHHAVNLIQHTVPADSEGEEGVRGIAGRDRIKGDL